MGELLEFTTWPNHKNVFYKITSNAVNFELKASGNAGIGIFKKIGSECEVMIFMGIHQYTWIKAKSRGRNNSLVKVETPDILSSQEYRKFWISWQNNLVRLGHEGQSTPFISYRCKTVNLKYITFNTLNNMSPPVSWKIELPPMMKKPPLSAVMGGELYWAPVDSNSQFPDDAYIGGYEKENLYIIRAPHRGSLTPGKFVSSEGLGYIPWGGEANAKDSFEVLCGYDCVWVPTNSDRIPNGAVVGGYSESRGNEKLFIGRAKHMGSLIIGKIQPSHKVCYIPYDDKEVASESYEILVVCNANTNKRVNVTLGPQVIMNINQSDEESMDGYDHNEDDDDDDVSVNSQDYNGFVALF